MSSGGRCYRGTRRVIAHAIGNSTALESKFPAVHLDVFTSAEVEILEVAIGGSWQLPENGEVSCWP